MFVPKKTVLLVSVVSLFCASFAKSVCPVGDLSGDCKVDSEDLRLFAVQWLDSGQVSADLNRDRSVDVLDFVVLGDNWMREGVPEYPVISEFMASNNSSLPLEGGELLDEDNDSSDWIELYNPTGAPIGLGGWYLTDDGANLTRWQFPAGVVIEPGSFLVVFASGKDRRDPAKPLHTNFKLAGDGQFLGLVTRDGVTIAHKYAPRYPQQLGNISYGLAQHATTLIAAGAEASYHVPAAGDAGEDWTSPDFDDYGWDTAKTALGFTATGQEAGGDVGTPSAKGSYSVQKGIYTVKGDGEDIWGAADAFYFVYTTLKGDGELTGRVVSVTNTNSWAKVGVMIRETLDAGSKHAMEVITPGNGAAFQRRAATGGSSSSNSGGAIAAPYWVRIVRLGNTITGFHSRDGVKWTQQGSETISMAEEVYIGLCVTSHAPGVLCTAVFDNVTRGVADTKGLKEKMLNVNASLWVRIEFNLEEGQADIFDNLTLWMKYEDGFVAYLNGQQVARRNAPASVQWNSSAPADRPTESSSVLESINLMPFVGALRDGKNVLAIHALNDGKANEEFLILPELVAASNVSIPQYFATATPGAFNVVGALGRVGDVFFSHKRGFYTAGFQLILATDADDATIVATLDGSRPTATNGTSYSGPIPVSKTTTVRAVAVKPGHLDSEAQTHSYIFVDDVVKQSPTGQVPGPDWPARSVNGQSINYGMDPDIVNDPRYKNWMDDALLAIPTISVVTDVANLFDPAKGIYVNANGQGRAWERPASVELLNPDGSDGFQIDAGLRIRGGYSRSGGNPKHAFRLFFRAEYGQPTLMFPLFDDEGVKEFECVDLRTSQNYSWSYGGDSRNTFLRDEFSRDTQGQMGQPYTRSRYYHLYLNGQYWGLFETEERPEASYAESYFGGDKDDYDVVKPETGPYTIVATDGDLEAYRRLWEAATAGFAADEAYYKIQGLNVDGTRNPAYERLVDLDNLIDYMLCTFYTGDFDGPISNFLGNNSPNNFYGIYNRRNPDGFRFFRHDAEHTLFEYPVVDHTWGHDRTGPFPAGQLFEHFNPQWLHQQLVAHPDYRMRFADRVYKYFLNDGLLTPSEATARLLARAKQIDLAIIAESARWGDAQTSRPLNREDHWVPAVNWIVSNYFPVRTQTVLDQFKSKGWYPDVEAPTLSHSGGLVPSGFKLSMNAPKGKLYYTLDGSDPRVPVAMSAPGNAVTLVAEKAAKRVLVPSVANGGNLLANKPAEFTVTFYKANIIVWSLETAESVVANPSYRTSVVTGTSPVVNFLNTSSSGNFGNDLPFPGTTINSDVDDYVVVVTGTVFIPETGLWTFGVNSDDGFGLTLTKGGRTYTSSWSSPRGASDTLAVFNIAESGLHNLRLVFYDRSGGSELELFAAKGSFSTFSSGQFRLVGDVAGGGLQVGEARVWFADYFSDSSWTSGTRGVGYETESGFQQLIGIDVKGQMYNKNSTCYIRVPFTVGAGEFADLILKVRYDDGFIAYLNGAEVARRNFTGEPAWTSAAASQNPDAAAVVFEEIDISSKISALRQGSNILAIHGLNESNSSPDFLISVELIARELSQGDISPSVVEFTNPVTLTKSTHVKARVLDGKWSALDEAVFAIGPVAENLRITEIMYHPRDMGDPNDPNTEFIELKNIGAQGINLNLVKFTNGIDFAFGDIDLAPNKYILVVKDRTAFTAKYGASVPANIIAGVYTGSLDNAGERIELQDAAGQLIHSFRYDDNWYDIADGLGFSLTVKNPASIGAEPNALEDKSIWRPSAKIGGSPGYDDTGSIPELGDMVINEIMAHSHAGEPDWIELHNTTSKTINIGGWFLSDSQDDLTMYRIKDGTAIGPNGYIVFYEDKHFNNPKDPGCKVPFALSENGETLYLHSGSGGVLTGYSEQEKFDASETGVSFGRYLKSTGAYNFVPMKEPTPGAANSYPKVGPVVINEIMYHPDGVADAEYVELLNITGGPVTLYDSVEGKAWWFTDDPDNPAIEFMFPKDTPVELKSGEYLLLVKDLTLFNTKYSVPQGVKVFSWGAGKLDNAGEKLQISKPGDVDVQGVRHWIRVDRVVYSDGTHPGGTEGATDPWPIDADGLGKSLSRLYPARYGNDPNNWHAAAPTPGKVNP